MRAKSGVLFEPLDVTMIPVITAADAVWAEHVPDIIPVITSGTDGHHGENSFHYTGRALDLRTRWDDTSQFKRELKNRLARSLRRALGSAYDVVVEGTHIHVEFDPR